jgi:hypothetical protein
VNCPIGEFMMVCFTLLKTLARPFLNKLKVYFVRCGIRDLSRNDGGIFGGMMLEIVQCVDQRC